MDASVELNRQMLTRPIACLWDVVAAGSVMGMTTIEAGIAPQAAATAAPGGLERSGTSDAGTGGLGHHTFASDPLRKRRMISSMAGGPT